MSGIAGIVNLHRNIDCELENVRRMTEAISHRGKGTIKVKNDRFGVFGATSFEYCESKDGQQPFSLKIDDAQLTICFDGLIYNSRELKEKLKCHSGATEAVTDAELALLSYIKWGSGCLQHINGIFAFIIYNCKSNELFLARDRFGIKPLYYTCIGDTFLFASEIKGILAHPSVTARISKSGLCEILGLGPAQIQGSGVFSGIYEVMPASCGTFNKNGLCFGKYWRLSSQLYDKSFEECRDEVRELTIDAINSQLDEKNRNMCFFLSGGLDSSIITALAARYYDKKIDTFSLRYAGNDEFFEPTEYQPTSDDYFIGLMSDTFDTNHHIVTIDNEALFELLYDAMRARDLPGMADVDSSLYFLCREMGSSFDGAVSGECADEVFGGYPWFHRKEDFDAKIFPWAKNTELRRQFISPDIMSGDEVVDFIYSQYKRSIDDCPKLHRENDIESRRREIAFLNLNWFMYSLGARSERIGMNSGLEIRMPFCDYRLVETLWNVPWEYKSQRGREKGLLRMCFEDLLPEEVLWRKKSPFPKTHNPQYEEMVKDMARSILADKNSPVADLINKKYIEDLMNKPSDYGKPWFGQLMATPQLYAYIIQLDMWLKEYNIKIEV